MHKCTYTKAIDIINVALPRQYVCIVYLHINTYSFPAVIVGHEVLVQHSDTTPTCTFTWLKNARPAMKEHGNTQRTTFQSPGQLSGQLPTIVPSGHSFLHHMIALMSQAKLAHHHIYLNSFIVVAHEKLKGKAGKAWAETSHDIDPMSIPTYVM